MAKDWLKCPKCGSELIELPCAGEEIKKNLGHVIHLRCPDEKCPTAYVVMDEHFLVENYRKLGC